MKWIKTKDERPLILSKVLLALSNLEVTEAKYMGNDLYTVESFKSQKYYSILDGDDRINENGIKPLFFTEIPTHPLLENY